MLCLLHQLEESQWLAPPALAELQATQLDALLAHAYETVPFYRAHWGSRPTARDFGTLPPLTRRQLQASFELLRSNAVPPSHGALSEAATSGSTGAPVRVLQTGLTGLYWKAIGLRDHAWHARDLLCKLASIRTLAPSGRAVNWGAATFKLIETGTAVSFEEERERDEQLRWLEAEQPDILLTHASNAFALAKRSLSLGGQIRLREVRTFGDALDPAAHDVCARAWGAKVTDMYSATEIGYLALQCPQHRHYHVQSEDVIIEVLDDAGRPCAPGETGRVVVTALHNFAMPLIRYAIGDMAEMGRPCACGRSLPVLNRIVGRTRNLMRTPAGRTYWPYLGSTELAYLAPIRGHQFVQKAIDRVEARLITDVPLTAEQEARVRKHFLSHLPEGIRLDVSYVASFPGSNGGKYEYFISELPEE